jgi:hypothetical protein
MRGLSGIVFLMLLEGDWTQAAVAESFRISSGR